MATFKIHLKIEFNLYILPDGRITVTLHLSRELSH